MPKNNSTTNDSSHQPGKNRVPTASDADGNEKTGKCAITPSLNINFQIQCYEMS